VAALEPPIEAPAPVNETHAIEATPAPEPFEYPPAPQPVPEAQPRDVSEIRMPVGANGTLVNGAHARHEAAFGEALTGDGDAPVGPAAGAPIGPADDEPNGQPEPLDEAVSDLLKHLDETLEMIRSLRSGASG
jgi:hypothetical protein